MNQESTIFVQSLVDVVDDLRPILHDHIEANFGEIIPHVFMADVARYVILSIEKNHDLDKIIELLNHLEENYVTRGEKIREIVAASFLENLPRIGNIAKKVRSMFGPALKKQFDIIG